MPIQTNRKRPCPQDRSFLSFFGFADFCGQYLSEFNSNHADHLSSDPKDAEQQYDDSGD